MTTKTRWEIIRDVDTQRERRQNDPEYRKTYNKMRRDYYAKRKLDPEYMEKLRQKQRKRREKPKS